MENNIKHSLTIEYGQGIFATAVSDVLNFNENEIRLSLTGGNKVIILGEKLKIGGFNKQAGELRLNGSVTAVKYSSGGSSVKRFFK